MSEISVMQEKIREWKAANRERPRELDFEMMMMALDIMNESSAVKVARNPLDADRNWISSTVCYNVKNVTVDDQGRLTLHIRKDKEEKTVESFFESIRRLHRNTPSKGSAVMLQISETKTVQLTDVYSHCMVKDNWAGLPFDIVFAYYEED